GGNIEAAHLIADGNAGRVMSGNGNRQSHVTGKGSAAGNRHCHADAECVDLAWRDDDETMPVLHLAPGDWVGVDPIDIAALGDVAADHHQISCPTGSPSWASATVALRARISSAP